MTSMLHTLSSTFITCACGSRARDCALTRLAEFVDNHTPLTPSPSPPSLRQENRFLRESDKEADRKDAELVDLGPLVGTERGFRTRERIPMSGGISGVELVNSAAFLDPYMAASPGAGPSKLPNAETGEHELPVYIAPFIAVLTASLVSDLPKSSARKGKAKTLDVDGEVQDSSFNRGKGGRRALGRSTSLILIHL